MRDGRGLYRGLPINNNDQREAGREGLLSLNFYQKVILPSHTFHFYLLKKNNEKNHSLHFKCKIRILIESSYPIPTQGHQLPMAVKGDSISYFENLSKSEVSGNNLSPYFCFSTLFPLVLGIKGFQGTLFKPIVEQTSQGSIQGEVQSGGSRIHLPQFGSFLHRGSF